MYRILCGSQEIFNGENIGELQVVSARQSEQLNESGNLQFTLAQGHPLYGLLEAMASYITAYDDNEIIFEGRVLECPKPGFSGQITYDCEGALSYLMDSEVTPSKNPMTKTVQEFFAWCIAQHNADIGNDPRRTFTVGNVTVPDRAKSEKFQITSYTQTKTVIENNLINVYGGYLKIRHENGIRYLDWLEHYSDQVNPQVIVLGENVIEQAFNVNGENLFTVIRPVGKNGLLLDTQTINVFSNEEINNKYGRIIRSVSFSDADTKAKLQTKANEYISRLKATLLCSGSIRLVDMHYLDGTSPKIKMGARFNNIQGLEGITMTVSGMERDYMEPYVDDCSFGNDKSLSDGTPKGGGSISRSTSRAGSSAGMNYKHIVELDEMVTINAETLNLHGETLDEHYEQITQTANQVITMSNDMDDMNTDLQTVMGTGVIQNDELLTQFAGTMRLVKNSQGIVTGIQFVDGTMVMDTVDGHMVTVGAAVAAAKNGVESIQGSSLWTMRDNVTGVVGEFDIVEDPVTHVKTVVIKSGGGMKIRQNNVEYGIYQTPAGESSAVLTGGLIVDKINDGTTTTKIKGTRVVLGTDLTGDDLNTWAADARAGTGVFAKYLTVKELSAQQITTLLANIGEAEIDHVVADQLTAEGSVHGSNVTVANHLYYGVSEEDEFNILDAEVNGDTLTLYRAHGDPITFRKAAGGTIVGPTWLNAPSSNPGSNSNTATFSIEGASGSGSEGSVQLYLSRSDNWENNIRTIYMSHTDTGTPGNRIAKITVDASTLVSNALTAGKNSAKVTGPTWATTPSANITGNSNTATFTTDADSPVSGAAKSLALYMTQGNWSSNKKYVYVHKDDSTDANRIARYEVDASTLVSNATTAGKNSAKVTGPTWATTPSANITGNSNTATFTTDADSPVSGAAKSLSLYMSQGSWSSNKKYVYVHHTDSTDANRIARVEVDASTLVSNATTAGKNSAKVTGPSWSKTPSADITGNSNTAAFTTDAANPVSGAAKSLALYMTQGSWSSNKKYVYVHHTNSTDANRIARVEVDASTLVSNATTAGKNSAKVTGPSWSKTPSADITGNSNTATFTTDAANPVSGAAKSLALYMTQGSWSSNKKYVYVHHTNSTDAKRIARVEVDASSIFNSGYNANHSGWIAYNKDGATSNQGYLGVGNYIHAYTNDINGNSTNSGGYWWVSSAWFRYVNSAGSNHQGDLASDSYIELIYTNSDASGDVRGTGATWHVPKAGSSYSHSATLYCYEISTGSTGVKTVRFSVQYSASQSVPFSSGRQYSMHW